jgi:restriction system protein
MGRRKKNSLARELTSLPWQVSAVLAVVAFAGLRWIVPVFLPQSPMFTALKASVASLSWLALFAFGAIAMLAAVRAKAGRKRKPQPSVAPADPWSNEVPAIPRQRSDELAGKAPTQWSLEALRLLEWKRFELLCAGYYAAMGFRTATLEAGPDGGVDVTLYQGDSTTPMAVVQCKAWNNRQVGVKEIRELLGVMAHAKVARGIFVTTGSYTKDAGDFGAANPIQLLDGAAFEKKILALSAEKQQELLKRAFEGDYRTPTCASCGVKMIARESKRGPFWGCMHYPRCKSTLPMRG